MERIDEREPLDLGTPVTPAPRAETPLELYYKAQEAAYLELLYRINEKQQNDFVDIAIDIEIGSLIAHVAHHVQNAGEVAVDRIYSDAFGNAKAMSTQDVRATRVREAHERLASMLRALSLEAELISTL